MSLSKTSVSASPVASAAGNSSGYLPYFDYHGIEPGAYYGIPYRQESGLLLPRSKHKKSFATRLANQLDKLTGGGSIRVEKSGSQPSRPHLLLTAPTAAATTTPTATTTTPRRRTFHNVVPGRLPPGTNSKYLNYDDGAPKHHFVHPATTTTHFDVEDYDQSYALLNANLCLCDDRAQIGTQRIRSTSSSRKGRCRSCGLERIRLQPPGVILTPQQQPLSSRRTQSEESLTNYMTMAEPFRRRLPNVVDKKKNGTSTWYDDDEEEEGPGGGGEGGGSSSDHDLDYAEADLIYSTAGGRKPPQISRHQHHMLRQQYHEPTKVRRMASERRASPERKVSNAATGQGGSTMLHSSGSTRIRQGDVIRTVVSSKLERPTPHDVTRASIRVSGNNRNSNEIVTINGTGHGTTTTRNSSIIYLSPNDEAKRKRSRVRQQIPQTDPPTAAWTTTTVTVNSPIVSQNNHNSNQGMLKKKPSGNSISSSSSPEAYSEEDSRSPLSSEDEDTTEKDMTEEEDDEEKAGAAAVVDLESEDDDEYDADCSQLESPKKVLHAAMMSQEVIPEEEEVVMVGTGEERLAMVAAPPPGSSNASSSGSSSVRRRSRCLPQQPTTTAASMTSSATLTKFEQLAERRRRQQQQMKANSRSDESLLSQDVTSDLEGRTASHEVADFSTLPLRRHYRNDDADDVSKTATPHHHHNTAISSHLFNDTTRIRLTSRPSVQDTFSNHQQMHNLRLSQSFKDSKSPVRPKEPPPPPPLMEEDPSADNRKQHSFNSRSLRKQLRRPPVSSSSKPLAERSKSFNPRGFLNRSLSQLPKSFSYNSLDRGAAKLKRTVLRRTPSVEEKKTTGTAMDRRLSAAKSGPDLVTVVPSAVIRPDGERTSFKDIRKILSSTSSASSSSAASTRRFSSQRSSSSGSTTAAVRAEASPSRRVVVVGSMEHIYEEIPEMMKTTALSRPLPPVPKSVSLNKTSITIGGGDSSDKSSPIKSIFEGATKYDILHYLEDARDRGLTDVELDLDEEGDEENEEENVAVNVPSRNNHRLEVASGGVMRTNSHRVSTCSGSSGSSSSDQPTLIIRTLGGGGSNQVDIERNDSGLGSETGNKAVVMIKQRPSVTMAASSASMKIAAPTTTRVANICLDCDQNITAVDSTTESDCEINFDPLTSTVCFECAKRRCERKEIITEIVDTEIKYGRDLRIIQEEFQRPMMVAGLLTSEQLSGIFLNVEELHESNLQFTQALRDVIEMALDDGDEDLCGVNMGKIFVGAEECMMTAFKSYCTRQASASALLAGLEKERELLRIFLKVSQMENTILRRMNLSSFLMVPVQRVTKYPLLLSRLLKVTPAHHPDRPALQEAREKIEHHLEHMNQEARDNNASTRLWRRISMINVASYRKMDNQLDVLGNTTWGIRKMALDVLGWTKEMREDVNFVLESRLLFTPTSSPTSGYWSAKMTPVSALLVTLGRNSLEPPMQEHDFTEYNRASAPLRLQFPTETRVRSAALLLIREKNNRYNMIRDPLFLDKCIICWEQEWEDCFEVQEFAAKEGFVFKADDLVKTRQWFRALQFYGLGLGQWRRRRNAMANIMISGTRKEI